MVRQLVILTLALWDINGINGCVVFTHIIMNSIKRSLRGLAMEVTHLRHARITPELIYHLHNQVQDLALA